jgi:signal recognition particle subunit SRP54
MVLDNLGDSLKRTMKKIANAANVDSTLIKEVVRDIQRALLQADVNVKLVLALSKKIEQRALEEKPPAGMSNREHVIHIVYEELVNILGASRELPIKKQTIMMVGLYGQGKCVHGESDIVLGSGEIISAESLYETYRRLYPEETLKDGTIIDISDAHLSVPSFNPKTLKMEFKKVTHLWKLAGKDLLNVFLDAGNDASVKVTPEHPFFVLRNGELLQIRADNLRPDDFIAVPRRYSTHGKTYDFFPEIKNLDLDCTLSQTDAITCIYTQYGSIKAALAQENVDRNYCQFTTNLKQGVIHVGLINDDAIVKEVFRIKLRKSRKWIQFPRYLTPNLAEFVGYVIGDGHVAERYVEITTADPEVIKRINVLAASLFAITPAVLKDKRSKAYRISLASTTLATIMTKVFGIPAGKKGPHLHVPQCLELSSNEVVARFLRAYFDCDGSICQAYRNIEITSESRTLIQQVNTLLRRFGIHSCPSRKTIESKPYWRLCIEARYAESYAKKIGSIIQRKQERLVEIVHIGLNQGCGKHDMIPLGQSLKEYREMNGFSIGKIQEDVRISYGVYERKGSISRETLTRLTDFYKNEPFGETNEFLRCIQQGKNLSNQYSTGKINAFHHHLTSTGLISSEGRLQLTENGLALLKKAGEYDRQSSLSFMTALATSDVCWIQVRQITKSPAPDFVFDLTIEDNHSFIANGIIVHNTTSCGKLAIYFKRKGLRPALIAGDIHRPAAFEQLQQIASQVEVPFYGEKGSKNAVKVIQNGMDKFKRTADVVIVDTSGRHKLEDNLIDEMTNIFKAIKPDEKLLVMDAAMGQQSGPQAKAFNDAIGITGIVLTKLDGTAKGGGALSASSEVGAPIVFVGTGEHSADFEKFDPSGFISRLLGMGDLKSLLERAEESMKGQDAEATAKKMMSGKFNLNDMCSQMDMLANMGPLSKIAEMLPFGMSGKVKDVDMEETQRRLARFKIIMSSMTNEEREKPDIIQASRIRRIAKGAGVENKDVKEVIKYYNQMRRMMKGFSSDRKMRRSLMRQLDVGK